MLAVQGLDHDVGLVAATATASTAKGASTRDALAASESALAYARAPSMALAILLPAIVVAVALWRGHDGTTGPMLASPRCGARTRSSGACRAPAVRGNRRCRMHGGAKGSGAPRANRNARKHGLFTREAIEERWEVRALLGEARKVLEGMK